ncbi:MAG: carnitine 3-dehydrogenase [SAR86 cluster bacterium]|nr:carnitine 3-dehydrogenase [Candidatus Pseudothioglobus aerophilus]MDO7578015.1 carnitine 3-dehydrogenase [SAR86 cluster bacterium]MDP0560760.1 carnitine 3-dehydrogenase [Candidatus Thioglobus sp.]MDP0595912.1 carnitine 3-dehydrogenase [SAR86 cluster bacterium]
MKSIKAAGVIGAGVIGSGWIARLLLNGIDVFVYDPSKEAPKYVNKVIDNAERAYKKLLTSNLPKKGKLLFSASISEVAKSCELIIEAVPERLSIKQSAYEEIESSADKNLVIASSTSGILPSDLQAKMKHPERLLVAHPFNPVYLLPLVEIVGGSKTSKNVIEETSKIFTNIGMFPLHIKKEIPAFIADRLLESVWREALWLVNDDIATTEEIDDAIRYGFGLRWAQMGLFETYRLAGGEAGMRHFISQFGPCLEWPWTHLMDVPEFTDELIEKVSSQSDHQSGQFSIDQLMEKRDDNLVDFLKVLKDNQWGAGNSLKEFDASLSGSINKLEFSELNLSSPLPTYVTKVPKEWADYNGHMTEARYLECFSEATTEMMSIIGADEEYILNIGSYFTVETHIRHLDEVQIGESIKAKTQVIFGENKKLHLFHWLNHEDGRLLATAEHMLIHVDLKTRGASMPNDLVLKRMGLVYEAHKKLPRPEGINRAVGDKF